MKNNKLTLLFTALSVALLIVSIVLITGQDNKAPEMSFSDADVLYTQDMDKKLLYEGVAAVDDRDGNITDKIVIEKIVQAADGESVSVTFAVNDSSNNFTKKVRTFRQEASEQNPKEAEE